MLGKEDRDAHHGEESGMLYYLLSVIVALLRGRPALSFWMVSLGGLHFDVISFFPFGVEINY